MEGKLIKTSKDSHHNGHYFLNNSEGLAIGSTDKEWCKRAVKTNPLYILSLKNCEDVFNGYDLDELAESEYGTVIESVRGSKEYDIESDRKNGFKKGFQKALEILGDKNKELQEFVKDCATNWDCDEDAHRYSTPCRQCNAEKLLQQTECGVEIVMETCSMNPYDLDCSEIVERLKLDSGGYLILKRK